MTDSMTWNDHQRWEAEWWGECTNTFSEEAKQLTYADRMGLVNLGASHASGHWPIYDLDGKSVLDIGGGPVSMLLKCVGLGRALVVDPCDYPQWVFDRYKAAGISWLRAGGEEITGCYPFDEVWLYNVLQHVQDPRAVIANARRSGNVVRIFEWVDTPPEPGHPHTLTADDFFHWFGVGPAAWDGNVRRAALPGESFATEMFTGENGCVGRAFYGVFPQ